MEARKFAIHQSRKDSYPEIIQIISKNHLAKKSPTEQSEPKSQKDITEEDLQMAHKHIK